MKLLVKTASFLAIALALGLGALALAGPHGGRVEAREGDCARKEVALDEGYGVSRIELREVCR